MWNFKGYPLKFHTKYVTHTLKAVYFIHRWKYKSSWIKELLSILTHWGRDKMAATSQTAFSYAFTWMKMNDIQLKFHWSLFLRIQLTTFQHWLRWWLGADQATSHYLNQWWLFYQRIYASLSLNELNPPPPPQHGYMLGYLQVLMTELGSCICTGPAFYKVKFQLPFSTRKYSYCSDSHTNYW